LVRVKGGVLGILQKRRHLGSTFGGRHV
jgi:hypothetical protein